MVKEWQDKAKNENEKEHNKIYKWRVRGSPRSGLYLKKVFCKNVTTSVHRGMDVPANLGDLNTNYLLSKDNKNRKDLSRQHGFTQIIK